ncbi:MAG: hypothetical protein ABR968_11925 [Bacteroidales bacterium]|jgi:hypothetical protein
MKKSIYLIIIALAASYNVNAQLTTAASKGTDATIIISSKLPVNYCAVEDGNWDNAATWSTIYGGIGGAGVPGANDNVVIGNGVNVRVNVNSACNNLTIEPTATLTSTNHSFSVNGKTDIFGAFLDNNYKGTDTFTGAVYVYIGGSWNSGAVTGEASMITKNEQNITQYDQLDSPQQ